MKRPRHGCGPSTASVIGHFKKESSSTALYTVTTPDWLLSVQQREVIATELVRIHTAAMNVPANLVHSCFSTYPRGHAYVANERSAVCSIVGVIPAGHTPEEKSRLVQSLWKMFKEKTEASDRDLFVALQEVAASQATENGWVMPEMGTRKNNPRYGVLGPNKTWSENAKVV